MQENEYIENPENPAITNLIITKRNGKRVLFKVDTKYLDRIQSFQWFATSKGYLKTTTGSNYHHRGLPEVLFGKREPGFVYDHRDRDPANNLASNIRYITWRANVNNKTRRVRGKSGIYGIFDTGSSYRVKTAEGKLICTKNLALAIYERARYLIYCGLTLDEVEKQTGIKFNQDTKVKLERIIRDRLEKCS